LFRVRATEWEAPGPDQFDALLFTSANALRHGGEQLQVYRGLRAYAVGESTAEAARRGGFDIAATGDSGIDRLLASIEPDLKLLHFCGEHRTEATAVRQQIMHVPVYRSEEIENIELPRGTRLLALIHSPRAGHRLAQIVKDRASIGIAAISRAAAAGAGQGWQKVDVAQEPTDDALLALAARLCKNTAPE
jgi:uroporphyrinogen-III synthase